jgi:hypothetical protein
MIEIVRWQEVFENADTRKRERLKSFHCPSGVESRGMVNLLCHYPCDKALAALGVFQLICQLSATLPARHRGRLVHSDGSAMSLEFIARLIRVETCHLSATLQILADKRIRWVLINESADNLPTICQSSPGFVQGEGEGEGEGEGKLALARARGSRQDELPTAAQVIAYAKSAPVPISPACAAAFHDTQEAQGWVVANGLPIRDWRAALRRYASGWNERERGKLTTAGKAKQPINRGGYEADRNIDFHE